MTKFELLEKTTFMPYITGMRVISFRGERGVIVDMENPHKPSSSGKVYVQFDGESVQSGYYPSVFGLKFFPVGNNDWLTLNASEPVHPAGTMAKHRIVLSITRFVPQIEFAVHFHNLEDNGYHHGVYFGTYEDAFDAWKDWVVKSYAEEPHLGNILSTATLDSFFVGK